jgi:hypothetical protein
MKLFSFIFLFLATLSCASAEELQPAYQELEGYKFFSTAKWKALTPLVSTVADVRNVMGEPRTEYDATNYAVDATAKQPSLLYDIDPDWEILFEFVKSDRSIPEALRNAVPNRLYKISLIPKKPISFKTISFPATMKKTEVRTAHAVWNEHADGSGLSYHVTISQARHGTEVLGRLHRIVYGPSDETIKRVIESHK